MSYLVTHFSGNVIFACQNTQILPRRTRRKVGDGIHRLLLTTGCDEDISVLLEVRRLWPCTFSSSIKALSNAMPFCVYHCFTSLRSRMSCSSRSSSLCGLQFSLRKRNHLDQGDLQLSSGAQRHLTEVEWITVIELDAFGATLADLLGADEPPTSHSRPWDSSASAAP